MYLVISKTCENCGNVFAIKFFKDEPDYHNLFETECRLGGYDCIVTQIIEIDLNDLDTIYSDTFNDE